MPHCTLEYSANIPVQFNAPTFFSGLHEIISSFESVQIEKIKSRAVRRDNFYLGNGITPYAFVYLEIAMFDGRSLELRQAIGKKALAYLKEQFAEAISGLDCSVNVEIREIEKATFASSSK